MSFADGARSGSITLALPNHRGVIYQMAQNEPAPHGKTWGQAYHEEVEALKADGTSNADAIRQVADKHGKQENAVRGGIHQYKSRHLGGNGSAPAARGRRGRTTPTVDGLMSAARESVEQALELVDREVEEAKAALDAAQAHYDEVVATVKDRKAAIEKQLKALS